MKPLLILLFCFLNTGFTSKPCQDRLTAKPLAIGYNEHYAFQQQDKSIKYSIHTRGYYRCSVRGISQREVSKEEWFNTLNEYRYEVVK